MSPPFAPRASPDLAWQPGDRLASLNGHLLRDVIDYRFYQADEQVEAVVDHDSHTRTYIMEKDPDEDLGGIHRTASLTACGPVAMIAPSAFKGLPTGLRRTLYLKDDGTTAIPSVRELVTLTNLREEDWERIAEQQLSPLYISVHASDPSSTRRFLGDRIRA